MTLEQRWNDPKTLKRRRNNVIMTLCAGWVYITPSDFLFLLYVITIINNTNSVNVRCNSVYVTSFNNNIFFFIKLQLIVFISVIKRQEFAITVVKEKHVVEKDGMI